MYSIDVSNNEKNSNKKYLKKITIPTRVVMNNKSIMVFAGETYETLKVSFDIQKTNFHPSIRDDLCFILKQWDD